MNYFFQVKRRPVSNPKPVPNPGKPVPNPGKPVPNPGKPVPNPVPKLIYKSETIKKHEDYESGFSFDF
jgi:hypothetical protein